MRSHAIGVAALALLLAQSRLEGTEAELGVAERALRDGRRARGGRSLRS